MQMRRITERWAAPILGLFMLLVGVILIVGGGWLRALGGSGYYFLAGFGLVVTGMLLWKRRIESAYLYLLIFLGTLIWAWWEVGANGWALVPRVLGPAVLLLLTMVVTPT